MRRVSESSGCGSVDLAQDPDSTLGGGDPDTPRVKEVVEKSESVAWKIEYNEQMQMHQSLHSALVSHNGGSKTPGASPCLIFRLNDVSVRSPSMFTARSARLVGPKISKG